METISQLSALEAAIHKKLTEAETRVYEANKIFVYYMELRSSSSKNQDIRNNLESLRRADHSMISKSSPATEGEVNPRRKGLFPGQLDNYVYTDDDQYKTDDLTVEECIE